MMNVEKELVVERIVPDKSCYRNDFTFSRMGTGVNRESWDILVLNYDKYKRVGLVASLVLDCGKARVRLVERGNYSKDILNEPIKNVITDKFADDEERERIFDKAALELYWVLKR